MAMGDECRVDLVTGRSIHHVKGSAEKVRDVLVQQRGPLVPIPTEPPTWVNPAHIVVVEDTDPDAEAGTKGTHG